MKTIPQSEWKWFGNAAHFICGRWCQFHMATLIGEYLVSTVGEYMPEESLRERYAVSRGVTLKGRGDERYFDYLNRVGFEELGYKRKFETMVFHVTGFCTREGCACGLPEIDGHERDFEGYNDAGSATRGHMAMCEKWSAPDLALAEREAEVGTA